MANAGWNRWFADSQPDDAHTRSKICRGVSAAGAAQALDPRMNLGFHSRPSARHSGGMRSYKLGWDKATRVGERYIVRKDLPVGSTSLTLAYDTSVSPAVQLSAKAISASEYASYLENEGLVWMTLRQNRHRNLPLLVGCHDPTTDVDTGYLFFSAFYEDLHTESERLAAFGAHRDLPDALQIIRQMTAAVMHCHRHRIVIGRLELGHFMWSDAQQTTIKLAHLDGARVLPPGAKMVPTVPASSVYAAPELLVNSRGGVPHGGFAADIWALGVAAHLLLLGELPSDTGALRDSQAAPLPPAVRSMLAAMLAADPTERITAASALEHPAFSERRHWGAVLRPHSDSVDVELFLPETTMRHIASPPRWFAVASASPETVGAHEVPEPFGDASPSVTDPEADSPPSRMSSKRPSLCAGLEDLGVIRGKRRASVCLAETTSQARGAVECQ